MEVLLLYLKLSKVEEDGYDIVHTAKEEDTFYDSNDSNDSGKSSEESEYIVASTVASTDGSVYEGEMQDGKKHGLGSLTYNDGEGYVGMWVNDKMEGHGRYYTGTVRLGANMDDVELKVDELKLGYVGEWKHNQMHGRGFNREKYEMYEGQWMFGKKHGKGDMLVVLEDGIVLDDGGCWSDSHVFDISRSVPEINERGGCVVRFKGVWHKGTPCGQGTYTDTEGTVYEGNWGEEGSQRDWFQFEPDNYTHIRTGDRYEGKWKDGAMQGNEQQVQRNKGHNRIREQAMPQHALRRVFDCGYQSPERHHAPAVSPHFESTVQRRNQRALGGVCRR